jgi:heme oxygenase (biliverdin-IX-beta and delta-forming)
MPNDAHAAPADRSQNRADDVAAAAPSHAERARTLVESIATGTLCTLSHEPEGYPYGSLVLFALEQNRPVFLISELAEHTKNLHRDARASLLVAESRPGDPLANGRVTLLGRCARVPDAERASVREAYLARHAGASYYDDFKDFGYWRLDVSGVRYIGGYGRMSWVGLGDWRAAEPDPLLADAAGILEHMNQDHADALPLYCRAFSRVGDVQRVTMTAIDRLGFEMSAATAEGSRTIRLAFHEPIATKNDARKALVGLLKEARVKLGVAT